MPKGGSNKKRLVLLVVLKEEKIKQATGHSHFADGIVALTPPNSYVEALTPNVMVFEDGAFERQCGFQQPEGSPLTKRCSKEMLATGSENTEEGSGAQNVLQ
ncbi:uncharacterized protein AAG666_011739 isoform 1-T2 [Megaptera novaeangliae]